MTCGITEVDSQNEANIQGFRVQNFKKKLLITISKYGVSLYVQTPILG